ncbi:MAG: helix-turn-helix domain-containing protein [Treponema sp.]|jgi:excisionase family DNA binding protein|nr:helix-turn-helix domain-containing protein [Treponema sp.]
MAETAQKPLNVKEAAEFLGLKPSYVYNLVHFGRLTAYKPGGKILFFKREDLERYAFRNRKAADYELAERADRALG